MARSYRTCLNFSKMIEKMYVILSLTKPIPQNASFVKLLMTSKLKIENQCHPEPDEGC